MREEHPEWSITTEILRMEKDESIVRATITSRDAGILAQATKREDTKGFADHLEKAETGAIGRALALCGYGTQFCADELDEQERLADSPVTPVTRTTKVISFGKFKGQSFDSVPLSDLVSYAGWLHQQKAQQGKSSPDADAFMTTVKAMMSNNEAPTT